MAGAKQLVTLVFILVRAGVLGKMAFESYYPYGRAVVFGSCAASVKQGKLCNGDLMKTLMLLELCEFCCAGAAHLSGAGLRCRKHGQLPFGADGLKEPESPRVECTPAGAGGGPGEMSQNARCDRGGIVGCFGAEGAMRCDTWLLRTCKGGTVRGRGKGRHV
jgi:hypothetical protein